MKIEHAYILHVDDVNSIAYAEECKRSCELHNLACTLVNWHKPPITTQYMQDAYNFSLNPNLDNPVNLIHLKEAMCSTGHMHIWSKIANEHSNAVAIFEHDALLKRDLSNLDVEDNEIVFLGYRLDSADDYECINDTYEKISTHEFCGTHAYTITPKTAKKLLQSVVSRNNFINLCDNCQCDSAFLPVCSVDWWLCRNLVGISKLSVVDPCPAIAVVGNRKSYTQYYEQVAKFNVLPRDELPRKFLQGIINKHKYFVDENNYLRFR